MDADSLPVYKDTRTAMTKLTTDHGILVRLAALVGLQTESQERYAVHPGNMTLS